MLWACDCCNVSATTVISADPPAGFHLTELTEVGKRDGFAKRYIWCDDCFKLVTGHFGGGQVGQKVPESV